MQLKYSGRLDYSNLLSQLFWNGIARHLHKLPDIIIPIPLHNKKHKQRGFNQSYELIREFTRLNPGVTVARVKRTKNTLQQANLNREQRISNIAGAFTITGNNLSNKVVAIIDDVVTTGSTVNELAKLCKSLGAKEVEIWCLMRA